MKTTNRGFGASGLHNIHVKSRGYTANYLIDCSLTFHPKKILWPETNGIKSLTFFHLIAITAAVFLFPAACQL